MAFDSSYYRCRNSHALSENIAETHGGGAKESGEDLSIGDVDYVLCCSRSQSWEADAEGEHPLTVRFVAPQQH